MTLEGYWFTSSKFDIEPGEDDEVNPRIYGRQLARWLKERLEDRGYAVEAIIDEDWGRCLMCSRDPFMLWVGCANVTKTTPRRTTPQPTFRLRRRKTSSGIASRPPSVLGEEMASQG